MKTEEHAWRALRDHAGSQLPANFADRVLRAARGPTPETWRRFQARASAQIRPGFAERVLRAARDFPANVPSLFGQFAFGAATVAICLATVVAVHVRSARAEEQLAVAGWQQIATTGWQQMAMDTPDLDQGR